MPNDNNGSSFALILASVQSPEVSPDKLRELLAVRRDWEADEARKAYHLAISEFQKRAPIIAKEDMAHDKQYARLDRIWRTIRPLVTELGLSVTWQVCELREKVCHVEGMLRHRDGHGEKLTQDIPLPELMRGQNAAQQMGSASTYARRYALCAALGVVTGDDDDGNGVTATISKGEAEDLFTLLEACRGLKSWKEEAFWGWVGVSCAMDIPQSRLADVRAMLNRKLKDGK